MTIPSLASIIVTGRQVDRIIFDVLRRDSTPDFRGPLRYHFKVGGKRIRAAIVMLSCGAAGGRVEDSLKAAAMVEMIHNYSLVMDDLIDRGDIRRGRPTVRVQFGDSVSLLVAMLYREVLDDLIEECPRQGAIRKIAVHVMKQIIDGERLDLEFEQAGRNDPYLVANRIDKPSLQLYLEMIGKKTASLFKAAAQVGVHSAEGDSKAVHALGHFGWKAGLAFQIVDDVLDIYGVKTGKEQAKDIIEHKLGNAAIITSMRYLSSAKRRELLRILSSQRVSRRQALKARRLMLETPAESVCREVAGKYIRDAKEHLSVLKKSRYVDSLASLAEQIVGRTF